MIRRAASPIAALGLAALAFACAPPPAAAPGPAGVVPGPPASIAPLAFAPLTADQVAFLRRRAGIDRYHAAAPAVIAGWDAPPETRGGNWAYHLHVPDRVLSTQASPPADAATTNASAAIDAVEVPFTADADPDAAYGRYAMAWNGDAQVTSPEAPTVAARFALRQLLPAPAVAGTPAPLPTTMVSASAREALAFYRDGARTVALRVRFADAPRVDEAKVDADAALAAVKAALADPKASCVEAETGKDYFVGLPFVNGDALPSGCLDFAPAAGEALRVEAEPAATFQAPKLERRFSKLVWRINEAESGPACRVGPSLETVFDQKRGAGFVRVHGAGGYVDALTGEVVRFRRNYRVYGVEGMGQPLDMFPGANAAR